MMTLSNLSSRIVKNANHADRHQFVDASAKSFSAQSKHKRNLLFSSHGDDIIQSFIQTTWRKINKCFPHIWCHQIITYRNTILRHSLIKMSILFPNNKKKTTQILTPQKQSPLAWIFSQLGEMMTHLMVCSFMCLVTSLSPMTRRRLDFALAGSFW